MSEWVFGEGFYLVVTYFDGLCNWFFPIHEGFLCQLYEDERVVFNFVLCNNFFFGQPSFY